MVDDGGAHGGSCLARPWAISNAISKLADCCSKRLIFPIESCQAIALTCVPGLIGSHTFMLDELSCITLPTPVLHRAIDVPPGVYLVPQPTLQPFPTVSFALAAVARTCHIDEVQHGLKRTSDHTFSRYRPEKIQDKLGGAFCGFASPSSHQPLPPFRSSRSKSPS